MKKKAFISIIISMLLLFSFTVNAAVKVGDVCFIDFTDIRRLATLVSSRRNVEATLTRAQKISDTEWVVHLDLRIDDVTIDKSSGDYRVIFIPNIPDLSSEQYAGKFAFYFSLLDANKKMIGYALAVREYAARLGEVYPLYTDNDYLTPYNRELIYGVGK